MTGRGTARRPAMDRPLPPPRLAAALFAVAGGCAPGMPSPRLDGVDPDWAWNGQETAIAIHGADLYPELQAHGATDIEVNRQYAAFLEGADRYALDSVVLVDPTSAEARVPAGIPVGTYDLVLRAPTGAEATLEGGFQVRSTREDHFALSSDATRYPVHRYALVEIQLEDPDGEPVDSPMAVEVAVTGGDASAVTFDESGLDAQEPLDEEVGVRGLLGAAGWGVVSLTSASPGDLAVEVRPADADSPVEPAALSLVFTAGDVAEVALSLPSADLRVTAGESFPVEIALLDAYGNVVEDAAASLRLAERCGDADTRYTAQVDFVGSTTVEDVTPTGASGTSGCADNYLDAAGYAGKDYVAGTSSPFSVDPGPAAGLDVRAFPDEVRAGESVAVVVDAFDEWGNAVTDYAGALRVRDEAGGLDPEAGVGEQTCAAFSEGEAWCMVVPWVADPADPLTVTADDGLEGVSAPIAVTAADPVAVVVSGEPSTVEAGREFGLVVTVEDRFGNPVAIPDPAAVELDDGHGSLSCAWAGSDGDGEAYACVATLAEGAKSVVATVPDFGLSGTSAPFEVTNGALASVSVDLGGIPSLTAGDTVTARVEAVDAWGNPYTSGSVSAVELSDLSGDVSGVSVPLDADGEGEADLTFTTAYDGDQVRAEVAGSILGSSASFDVVAGPQAGFDVALDTTWTPVDEPLTVIVTAVDAYDNAVTGYSGTVTLTSEGGLASVQSSSAFLDGTAEVAFTYDDTGMSDRIAVTDGVFTGRSPAVDVVRIGCAAGPTASVLVGGADELVLCLDSSGSTAPVSVDASGSADGAASLAAWHHDFGEGEWVRSTTDTWTTTWEGAGPRTVRVLVVDEDGCADEATAAVWVGEDDGTPVGPVSVEVADATIEAGGTTGTDTEVTLTATDCQGDPAASADLYLWADMAEVGSTSASTVRETGAGLAVQLDANGQATVSWSAASTATEGEATLRAGLPDAVAYGAGTVTIEGDSTPPRLLSVSPVGRTAALFDAVELTFSEPMRQASFNGARVILTDPTGVERDILSFDFDAAGEVCTATLDDTYDAAAGVWSLSVSSELRDLGGGNRLDARSIGGASSITLQFGDVADTAPDVSKCALSTSVFRPDGDASGGGSEADEVTISVAAASAPSWWTLTVLDADGEEVLATRAVAAGASDSLTWDGRDVDGFIVDNGTYTLVLGAEDAYWNEGATCTGEVAVDNRIVAPEGGG